MVSLEVRGVVFLFEDGFPEKDEGPGDGDVIGSLPHFPSATESIPGILSGGAVEEAVLGRLGEALVTTFASGLEPHSLEPSAYREPFVEGQPYEGSNFAGTGVVPNPSHNLGGSGVAETQTLDEVDDSGGGAEVSLCSGSLSWRSSRRRGRLPCCVFVANANHLGPN